MSLYSEYLKERLDEEVIEHEDSFASFRFIDDQGVKTVYIVDIYVRPHFRNAKVASCLADEITIFAKERGCKRMIGTVSASAKNATQSIMVLIGYGMDFYRCNNEGLIFKKEI